MTSLDIFNLQEETVENKVRKYLDALYASPTTDTFQFIDDNNEERTYTTLEPVDLSYETQTVRYCILNFTLTVQMFPYSKNLVQLQNRLKNII